VIHRTVDNSLRKNNEESVDWTLFFNQKRDIVTEDGSVFCIYETRATDETSEETQPLFIFHHGAGQSALSFALTARELQKRTNNQCSIVCYDCRGHGEHLIITIMMDS
jgi:pimeloyl-ACP methyl ester carboxylesterase